MPLVQKDGECRPELSGAQSNSPEAVKGKIAREKAGLFNPFERNIWICRIPLHAATSHVATEAMLFTITLDHLSTELPPQ